MTIRKPSKEGFLCVEIPGFDLAVVAESIERRVAHAAFQLAQKGGAESRFLCQLADGKAVLAAVGGDFFADFKIHGSPSFLVSE